MKQAERVVNFKCMTAAVYDDPVRIAFTMSRYNLLRLAWNAAVAAILGEKAIAISTDSLEVLSSPATSSTGNE